MIDEAVMSCPEPVAVPIVFIPGIMGSRLRQGESGPVVFDPDLLGNVRTLASSDAVEKRLSLVGGPGIGFTSNYLTVHPGTVGNNLTQEQFDRGWGGVLQGFYRGFLIWLQNTAQQPVSSDLPPGCFNLNYEVWAHPYNWTNDNSEAGKSLDDVVAAAISGTEAKYAGQNIRVLKPIIITHSMGGLVSRAYTQIHGGTGKVHGIIHGAMPTDGAPALYKRLLAGFEEVGPKGFIERHVLGANQRETTATAGNCPGPLQLLPNMRHRCVDGGSEWLKVRAHNGQTTVSEPSGNPYGSLYLDQQNWWRPIYAEFLDPSSISTARAFQDYVVQLNKAASYHGSLGTNGFHPNTRMFYSDSASFEAWDYVVWQQTMADSVPVPGDAYSVSGHNGHIRIENVLSSGLQDLVRTYQRFEIQDPSARGDGTVHSGSGKHVPVMSVPTSDGFTHAEAFNPRASRRIVGDWMFEMVMEQL